MVIGIILLVVGIISLLFQSIRKTRNEILLYQNKKRKYKTFLTELNNLLK